MYNLNVLTFWDGVLPFWLFSCRIKMNFSGKEINSEHLLLIEKFWFWWWRLVVPHRLYQRNTRNLYHLSSVLLSYSPISHPKCSVKLRLWWVQPRYLTVSLYVGSKTLLGQKQTVPEPLLVNTNVVGINWIQRVLLMLLLMTISLEKWQQSHKAEWFCLDPSLRFRILHCLIQQSLLLNRLNLCLVLPIQPLNPPNLQEFSWGLSLLVRWSFQRITLESFLTGLTQELPTYLITASWRVAVLILDAPLLPWKMCFFLLTPVIPLRASWASVFTATKILDRIWTSTYTGICFLFFCIHPLY